MITVSSIFLAYDYQKNVTTTIAMFLKSNSYHFDFDRGVCGPSSPYNNSTFVSCCLFYFIFKTVETQVVVVFFQAVLLPTWVRLRTVNNHEKKKLNCGFSTIPIIAKI